MRLWRRVVRGGIIWLRGFDEWRCIPSSFARPHRLKPVPLRSGLTADLRPGGQMGVLFRLG